MPPVEVEFELSGPEGAPILVLANSLGTTPSLWDDHLADLSARFRVLRYDHRGHGRSPVPPGPYTISDLGEDMVALLDRIGAPRAHLAGVSLGGMVAMWVASHFPDRVERMVLLSTSAHMPPADMWLDRATAVRKSGMVAVTVAALQRWFTPEALTGRPELVDRFRAMLLAAPPAGYANCCDAIAVMDQRPDLPRISAPTLVVCAAGDPSTPPEHAATIAEGIPGARMQVLPEGAHLVTAERPDTVTPLIVGHLEQTA